MKLHQDMIQVQSRKHPLSKTVSSTSIMNGLDSTFTDTPFKHTQFCYNEPYSRHIVTSLLSFGALLGLGVTNLPITGSGMGVLFSVDVAVPSAVSGADPSTSR